MNSIKHQLDQCGFAVVPKCIPEAVVEHLTESIDSCAHSARNLLDDPIFRDFAASNKVRRLAATVLGRDAFAVRGIYFNKNSLANWKVTWHQDCVIAVRDKIVLRGWGPWSRKAGVTHVRPPADIIEQMLAIRIHLDDCAEGNGPLRVVPGTHLFGFLSDDQVQNWPKDSAVVCVARRGDAVLMRPLLLHASSSAVRPSNRRVIHLEFAARELADGMQWRDRVF